jgi:hypothetical protein
MNKRLLVIIFFVSALIIFLVFFFLKGGFKFSERGIENQLKATPTPTAVISLTKYSHQKYNFSIEYPAFWSLPLEEEITPSQEHLYQITLNPQEINYFIDLYKQPMTVSVESFLRDYFKDFEGGVSYLNREKINNHQAVEFFIPKAALEPTGKAGVAFRKDDLILILSTSFIHGEKEDVFTNETFANLIKSFTWLD